MKHPSTPQSATSLPAAPRADASSRMVKYLIMMVIRVACFGAMVLVTPYGWYTWLFAAGAVFLPYVAVVIANVGQEGLAPPAERPEQRAITERTPPPADPLDAGVIRISETPPKPDA